MGAMLLAAALATVSELVGVLFAPALSFPMAGSQTPAADVFTLVAVGTWRTRLTRRVSVGSSGVGTVLAVAVAGRTAGRVVRP